MKDKANVAATAKNRMERAVRDMDLAGQSLVRLQDWFPFEHPYYKQAGYAIHVMSETMADLRKQIGIMEDIIKESKSGGGNG